MADGKVEFETGISEKGLNSGLDKIKKALKGIGSNSTVKSVGNLGMAFSAVTEVIKAGIAAVKAAKAAIDDLTGTYKIQAQAETQLAQAAKNNPYLLSENVNALKKYASELQKVSTYGDEQLLPFMAQLASSGRTQQEIMDIMSASVNVAASGIMSLDSAVSALNGTYNGNIGLLGRQIGELKGLTAEQLKNGDAVRIISQKYDGMAKEVAKATGTSQQLKNAVGDLKEELGAPFEKAMSPVRAFFTALISGWADARKERREYKEEWERIRNGTASASDYKDVIEKEDAALAKRLEKKHDELAKATERLLWEYNRRLSYQGREVVDEASEEFQAHMQWLAGPMTAEVERELSMAQRKYRSIAKIYAMLTSLREEYARKAEDEEKERSDALAAQNKAAADTAAKAEMDARDKLREEYDETIRQKQEEINQRRINGEEISAEAEAQEMYNTALSAYIRMMSDPAFEGNSGNYEHEVNARKDIADWGSIAGREASTEQLREFENELTSVIDEINGITRNQYNATLDLLDAEYNAVIENKHLEEQEKLRIEREFAEKRKQIVDAQNRAERDSLMERIDEMTGANESYWARYETKLEDLARLEKEIETSTVLTHAEIEAEKTRITETAVQARMELIASITDEIATYTGQAVQIMQDAASLMLDTVRWQSDAELAELELRYRKGEIGEEEYNEAIAESKKKAAKEQYKIQMWQWSASILQATANIAQGGVAGMITGALVAAAGSVQIASIIASKPTPPSFASGGIVPGNSYSGDRVQANVNSGEMILNAAQQRSLWEAANGRGAGGGTNIVINNSASNIVSARPEITEDKIKILIDARVNEGLRKGKYDQSLAMANDGMGGDMWGI